MNSSSIKELTSKVEDNILKYKMIRSQRIIVGLSGGPDSVCLLHVLWSLSKDQGISLHPVHVNHMLRDDESDGDEEFCRDFCESIGLSLKVWRVDIIKSSKELKKSIEETAREVRYSLFREYAEALGGADIAVGHNMDDQAETLLMRIIRGTGLDGLKGMEFYRDGIIRPLLSVPRSLIETYNSENNLRVRIDSSNLHTDYTRNKVRLELLPHIKELLGVDAVPSLYRLSQNCADDLRLLENITENEYRKCLLEDKEGCIKLSIEKLNNLPMEMLGRIIRRAMTHFTESLKGIQYTHIELVKKIIVEGRTGAVLQLPECLRVYRAYTEIIIFKEKESHEKVINNLVLKINQEGEYTLQDHSKLIISYLNIQQYKEQKVKSSQKSLIQFFDRDIIKELAVRNRQNGDLFFPYGSNGTKKLKEYFIDEKINKEIRDKLILFCDGRDIIWIVGMRTSDKFKINEKTINVLKIEFQYK